MVRETELLFDNVMRQISPVTELLTANYTFVNERLVSCITGFRTSPSVCAAWSRPIPIASG